MCERLAIERNHACLAQVRLDGSHGGLARPALAVDQPVQREHAQSRGISDHWQLAVGEALLDFGEVHGDVKKSCRKFANSSTSAKSGVMISPCADQMS